MEGLTPDVRSTQNGSW